jgi:Transposase
MIEATKLIAHHLPNVLTYLTHRITNAVAEGLNSKIATVQKRACGWRNPNHFKIAVYFHCGGLSDRTPQIGPGTMWEIEHIRRTHERTARAVFYPRSGAV